MKIAAGKNKRILIALDDVNGRKKIMGLLAHFNFDLFYTVDGLHALKSLRCEQFQLAIIGCKLPIINGMKLAEIYFKENPSLPIIFINDCINVNYARLGKMMNAKAFITEPYEDNKLLYSIKKSLDLESLKAI